MTGPPLPRSWLYVPASRQELLPKALAGDADAIVLDLEDAVLPRGKEGARRELARLLDAPRNKPVWVRANDPRTQWGRDDLAALARLPVDGVRLPKTEDPDMVADLATALRRPLHLLLESARGVENASALARCSEWVRGLALGEADLLADLGGLDASALGYSRGRVVSAARAARLPAPVMCVYTAVADLDGLRADSLAARAAGFFGRSVVHPRQVPVVNAAFLPSADEISNARGVIETMRHAQESGLGAQVDEHGGFVDAAVRDRARQVLALAEYHSAIDPECGDELTRPAPDPAREDRT